MEGETYDWAGAGFLTAMADTVRFYRCLLYFLFGGTYKECPYFMSRLQVGTGKPVFGCTTSLHPLNSSSKVATLEWLLLSCLSREAETSPSSRKLQLRFSRHVRTCHARVLAQHTANPIDR